MHKGAKSKCTSSSHRLMVDNAKNRLDDLQERFSNLQAARQQGRVIDVAVLEEQVYQSIREWKAELDAPSRESSLVEGSLGSFSADIARLLQLCEEEDDATSALAGQQVLKPEPVPEPNVQSFNVDNNFTSCQQDYLVHSSPQGHNFQMFDQSNMSLGFQNMTDVSSPLDFQQLLLDEGFTIDFVHDTKDLEKVPETSDPTYVSPPPSAFMGPKCALWDCSRPAQGYDLYKDYCSSFHANLSSSEGAPGSKPVLRPKGIGLKDSLLFNAVVAKAQGQDVGIPLCEGAASMKSPWNATELFDLSLLEGETLREWLFFDKPRRAFDSGNRKQRSLPDYNGRGWHESRKQVMKEFDGQKRSYYMDPQPPGFYEWHLFEYEMNNCDAFALYRLELKLAEKKKTPKGKVPKDSLADLRKKMGRLTAEVTADDSPVDKASVKSGNSSNAEVSDLNQDQKFIGMGSLGQISVQSPLK